MSLYIFSPFDEYYSFMLFCFLCHTILCEVLLFGLPVLYTREWWELFRRQIIMKCHWYWCKFCWSIPRTSGPSISINSSSGSDVLLIAYTSKCTRIYVDMFIYKRDGNTIVVVNVQRISVSNFENVCLMHFLCYSCVDLFTKSCFYTVLKIILNILLSNKSTHFLMQLLQPNWIS